MWFAFQVRGVYDSVPQYRIFRQLLLSKYGFAEDDVHIPGNCETENTCGGYVFVRIEGDDFHEHWRRLCHEKQVLGEDGYLAVPDGQMEEMLGCVGEETAEKQDADFRRGDVVSPVKTVYSGLFGIVLEAGDGFCDVGFNFFMGPRVVRFPNDELELVRPLFEIWRFPVSANGGGAEGSLVPGTLASAIEKSLDAADDAADGEEERETPDEDGGLAEFGGRTGEDCIGEEIAELFGRNDIVGFYENEVHEEGLLSFESTPIEDIEEEIGDYFGLLTREERDFIYLNFLRRKTQVELTEIFGKTQPALCNDAERIREEMAFLRRRHAVTDMVVAFLTDPRVRLSYNDRNILLAFFYSSSITKTAQIVGLNPMLCRVRIRRAVDILEGLEKEIHGYFRSLLDNLNVAKKAVSDRLAGRRLGRRDYAGGFVSQELDF